MSTFKIVRCRRCKKRYYKDIGHINENLKLGHNFYCSRVCESKSKNKQKLLVCENPGCNKKFYRMPNDITAHNFCSKSCAAIINNQRYPKWPKRYCKVCGKEFKNRESKYCSSKCGWSNFYHSHVSKYTEEQIISLIKNFYQRNERTPAKREVLEMVGCATNKFGSWNKAIVAAGLTPHRSHDNRMYKRINTKALDGHLCDSISEALIDNWLAKNKIPHERNIAYPNTNHRADWGIKGNKIFIECFGLAKDSPRYDRSIRKKKKLCNKLKIKLIEIYPKDLYPEISLDSKLEFLQKVDTKTLRV